MGMVERKGVQVTIILIRELDIQKAYNVASEATTKLGGVFSGINVFSFGGNPPRDRQSLSLFVGQSNIGEAVDAITRGLGLAQNEYLVQAFPTSQYLPRSQSSPITA